MTFEEWWDKGEAEFLAQSLHMSEYHMASIVWEAATKAQREADIAICKLLTAQTTDWLGGVMMKHAYKQAIEAIQEQNKLP